MKNDLRAGTRDPYVQVVFIPVGEVPRYLTVQVQAAVHHDGQLV